MNAEPTRPAGASPDAWKHGVAVGLGALLVASLGINYGLGLMDRRSAVQAASGQPTADAAGAVPGGAGAGAVPALPAHRRDPFTPLPKKQLASAALPGHSGADGSESLAPANPDVNTSVRPLDGSAPPFLPEVGGSAMPGAAPPAGLAPLAPKEVGMTPTTLMGTAMGVESLALFQYGTEVLERKAGDCVGIYRVTSVDHGRVGLMDRHHNQVWLLSGQTVGGAPSAAAGAAPEKRAVEGTRVPAPAGKAPISSPSPVAPVTPASPKSLPAPPPAGGTRISNAGWGSGGPLPLERRLLAATQ